MTTAPAAAATAPVAAAPALAVRPGPAMFALDLDGTVIFSANSRRLGPMPPPAVTVEIYDRAPLSSMTLKAHEALVQLTIAHTVVPTTTRTPAQYRRVTLPGPPALALCLNGAVLLRDGDRCPEWDDWAGQMTAGSTPLADVFARFSDVNGQSWVKTVKQADNAFCYLIAHTRDGIPEGWAEQTAGWLDREGWALSVQGRKAYAIPALLSKVRAVCRLAGMLGNPPLYAAGDSLLDAGMLLVADAAIRPAHGELQDAAWVGPGVDVTRRDGILAGEDILGWATAKADAHPAG